MIARCRPVVTVASACFRSARRRGVVLSCLVLVLVLALAAPPVGAQVVPQAEPMHAFVVAPTGFVATVAPQPLDDVSGEVHADTLAAVESFRTAHGLAWSFYIDRRSGGMALVEGAGIPWISGATTADDLEAAARAMIDAYPGLFRVASDGLELDEGATRNFGDRGQFWQIGFRQVIGGVPVEDSHLVFRVSHGNLVQFGVDRVVPASQSVDTVPTVSAAAAKASLGAHVGGLRAGDLFLEDGVLQLVLRGSGDTVGFSGPIGAGWQPELAWRFRFQRAGSIGLWEALVDAHGGGVLRLVDSNDYAAVVRGSVYTRSNCGDATNCVPGDIPELPVTMPHARLQFDGGASGNAFSNSAGAFEYPAGALTATTDLEGRYFVLTDNCGPISAPGANPGNIDLGTTDPNPSGTNTDCVFAVRESSPNTGPVANGTGDTHAARNMYYHLNLINEKSRFYLPHNDWLQGIDGTDVRPSILTNIQPACNAFWSGGIDSLVFMRVTPGLQCNNTGESLDVGLHEFGHGMDEHDGTGTAPESSTGEAMGDSFALLQSQASCIGVGFRLSDPSAPNWGNTAGYGDGRARLCSGVRELDHTRYCRRPPAPLPNLPRPSDCGPSIDPDSPNGSRSGLNPPAEPNPDVGTPARWNHMLGATAPAGVADGYSNFYNCGGPETTGCAGPLEHGCHCESLIASQANWDLAKGIIASEFGGDVYADSPGPTEVSGWQYMDRLWYLTRDLAVSAYSVTGDPQATGGGIGGSPYAADPTVSTNGCGATNWFATYRFVDDDNGNLADGTPHADLIYEAFELHAIACGQASDPANQRQGCPAPVAAPTLSSCGTEAPVQLEWTASAGAEDYRVLRNTLGCEFGFTPLAVIDSSRTYFEDAEVASGVPYYYSVQPVGANASCYGFASNCHVVSPTTCDPSSIAPPTGVSASDAGSNQVEVTWSAVAGAQSYKVLRAEGACASAGPYSSVGVTSGTAFTDGDRLVAGRTYSYRVAASESACASCTSEPSECVEISVSGTCEVDPDFAGAASIHSATDGQCALSVAWGVGSPNCGGSLSYSVFRSTDRSFTPAASNQVASGLTGTAFTDTNVLDDVQYTYIVRATDEVDNTEGNTTRKYERPVGDLTPGGTFEDDAGDTGEVKLQRGLEQTNTWSIRATGGAGGSAGYATTASGNYLGDSCMSLETETVYLGANPTLTFSSSFDIEPLWDGAIVQVATANGGFSDWTKLDLAYPGVMGGPIGDTACSDPGLADGEAAFTGTSGGVFLPFATSLASFANQAVRVRFLFGSDGGTHLGGFFVDDVAISDVQTPGACESDTENRPPQAVDDSARTDRDTAVTVDVLANDSDPDGDALSVISVTQPDHGTATINGDDTVTYQPDAGFGGFDSFAYRISDGKGGEAGARVTVEVVCPANDGFSDDFEPSAEPGWSVDTAVNAGPASPPWTVVADPFAHSTTNAYFSDATTLFEKDDRLISPPVTLSTESRLVFWHRFDLESTFDGGVLEVSTDGGATWADVVAAGGAFVAGGYNDAIAPGFGSAIAGRDAWTGFSEFFNAMNRVEVSMGAFAGSGVLVRWRLVSDPFAPGALPGQGWWIDDVQFTAAGISDCNLAPQARDDEGSTLENTPVTIDVLANDTDPNGDPLTVTTVTDPPNGTAADNGDGTVTYQPDPGFVGVDVFEYTVTDGEFSDDAMVVVTVEEDDDGGGKSKGKTTGGGRIADGSDEAHFGFNAHSPAKGRIHYDAKGSGVKIKGTVTAVSFPSATEATFGGPCELADGSACTYEVQVEDNGEPGRNDRFEIRVFAQPLGTLVHENAGTLSGGNIQVH